MLRSRTAAAASLWICLGVLACGDPDRESSSGTDAAERSGPLSSVLITLDTTRADSLTAYGGPANATPHMDHLAREGLRYEAARTVAPITMPAHASMLTGLFPPRHTVRNNNIEPLPQSALTLAELARESGFATAAFVSSVVLDPALGFNQGFERYESPRRRESLEQPDEKTSRETVDEAIAWLAERDPADGRFFLWLHLFDPHDPYEPPAEFASRFPENPYLAEVASMDSQVGRLLAHLAEEGQLADTLVMLVGDHGEALGEHGEKFHGIHLYDATVRVPLIVRDPTGWRAGESTDEIVSVADVFPTLADAMGLPKQPDIDGVSLFRRSVPEGRGVYFETYQAWILHGYAPSVGWADARGKYLHAASPEFYQTHSDPDEKRNLAAQHALEFGRYQDAIAAIVAAPSLSRSDEPLDHSMVAELQALGYAAATTGDDSFPHPLDVEGRPSPARYARENASSLRAMSLAKQGQLIDAIAIYRLILMGNPNNWMVVYDYGFALMRAGRHGEALDEFRRYQAGGPPLAAAFMNAGLCLLRLEREPEASQQFERAVKLDGYFAPALKQLVRLHREAGRLDESKRWQEKLRKVRPDSSAP